MTMDLDINHPNGPSTACINPSEVQWRAARPPAVDEDLQREILALVPDLRRYARALTRDVVDADDLVQDSLCRALAKIGLWDKGSDLRAWLFTILHHRHVSEIRRAVRRGVSVAVEDVALNAAVAADALSALQLRDLERAIASLPEARRQVILLVGLEGLTYEDVAAILGIPIGTVRSRLARGRETLRRLMDVREKAAKPAFAEVRNPC
jgi:RNA polymerase sigma-70 factor, ECF subfamily